MSPAPPRSMPKLSTPLASQRDSTAPPVQFSWRSSALLSRATISLPSCEKATSLTWSEPSL